MQNLAVTAGRRPPPSVSSLLTFLNQHLLRKSLAKPSSQNMSSIVASYQVTVTTQSSSGAVSAQLSQFVSSGAFNKALHSNAAALGATAFATATSKSISVRKYLIPSYELELA